MNLTYVLSNIDQRDYDVFKYLIDNKIFPTIATSPDLRNNPYYELEDKYIQLVDDKDNYRVYTIPYAGQNRFTEGSIYDVDLIVYDNGNIQFGDCKIRDIDSVAVSTLKKDYFQAR